MSHDLEKLLPVVMQGALAILHKYGQGDHRKTQQSLAKAKTILKNDESTATAVFIAMQRLLGSNAFLAWEPESIWLELADQGVKNFSRENRDKLLAIVTLIKGNAFYWDAALFENVIMAFNNVSIVPDAIMEAAAGEIAWGVYEAEFISQYAGHDGEYDYEPARYTAASMHRAGLVLAPEILVFAQDELDKFNSDQKELQQVVNDLWGAADKEKLEDLDLDESPASIQVGRLAAFYKYVGDRANQLREELIDL